MFCDKKSIIITGATGFVGSHVTRYLVSKGHNIVALVRDINKAQALTRLDGAKLIRFDLSNRNEDMSIFDNAFLIHCAWDDVRNTQSEKHIENYFMDHYLFLKKAIEQGVKKIVVTGSCYEYGLQYGAVCANTSTKPNTPYALAKDFLHKSLRVLQNQLSFDLIWARLFYMYGEGQDDKAIIPLFDKALENNDSVFNMSFGEQLFDYLSVETVAERIGSLVVTRNDGIFNICSGNPISLRRLLELRMAEKNKKIDLNLGYYPYRLQDSIAIWGADPFVA